MPLRSYILSLIYLIIGTSIYVFFRQDVYFLTFLQKYMRYFSSFKLPDSIFTDFIIYNLSDAMWCLAMLTVVFTFDSRHLKIIALILPIGMEICQLAKWMPGTFDPLDLTIYLIISIFFILLWKRKTVLHPSLEQ